MIEELEIVRFRGLRDLKLAGFSRINLFVGENGLGKTSVVEAIACTCNGSSPAFFQYLSQLRGFPLATLQNDMALRSFFNRFEIKEPVESKVSTNERGWYETVVTANQKASQSEPSPSARTEAERLPEGMLTIQSPDAPLPPDQLQRLEFAYTHPAKKKTHPANKKDGKPTHSLFFELGRTPVRMPPASLCGDCLQASFLKPGVMSFQETVSIVSNAGLHAATKRRLLQAFRVFRPGIKDFQAVPDPSGYSYLYLIEEGGAPQPAQALGEGFCWSLSIIAQVLKSKAAAICIDEIGTGLHRTVMNQFWGILLGFMGTNPTTQLFATTHSEELVEASLEAFANQPDYLRIYRFSRGEQGKAIIREGGYETIESLHDGHIFQT